MPDSDPPKIQDDAGAFKEALDFMPRGPLEKQLVGQAVNRLDQDLQHRSQSQQASEVPTVPSA